MRGSGLEADKLTECGMWQALEGSEVVEVGLHVEAVEEMLKESQHWSTTDRRVGPTLYKLMTLTTQASRWKIFLFPTRIRASCKAWSHEHAFAGRQCPDRTVQRSYDVRISRPSA